MSTYPHSSGTGHALHSRDAREAAWLILLDFEQGHCDRLAPALEALALEDREEALARELIFGVARYQRLYDALCRAFLRPGSQPPPLRVALRLAAHQLFALDRIPAHAAVDTSVELLRHFRHTKLTGVANAVIRRLSALRLGERTGPGPLGRLQADAWPKDPAILHSLPDGLVADVLPLLDGKSERLAGLNQIPHLCTRSRPGMPHLNGHGILRQEGEWTWWSDPSAALAGPVALGQAVVQDRSQGRLIDISRARPGELVLDLCAAPGGKSLAFIDRGCQVIAADLSVARIARLRANLPPGAAILVQDACRPALATVADIVVVDVPCSNSGVLGRRPEARWRYQPELLVDLEGIQRALLASAAGMVAAGGKLIYATCSVSPRENQGVAHGLDGWRVLAEESSWPDEWQGGGYAAVLVRSDATAQHPERTQLR